jgi:hypothetical protein
MTRISSESCANARMLSVIGAFAGKTGASWQAAMRTRWPAVLCVRLFLDKGAIRKLEMKSSLTSE